MKRGQLWYADVILALMIVVVIMIFFALSFFDIVGREDKVQDMLDDAITITNSVMSPGYEHTKWCTERKGRIGFVEDYKLIKDNFKEFEKLVDDPGTCLEGLTGYETSKILLGVPYDYLIYLQNKDGNFIESPNDDVTTRTYGKYKVKGLTQETGLNDIFAKLEQDAPENKINFFRFVYYDPDLDGYGEIIKLGVVLWD